MKVSRTRYLTLVAIFSAVSFGLMFLEFAIPSIVPSFIKMDFSELPALIASFALGPGAGVLVCFFKNLLHMAVSKTAFVGELANFLIGVPYVFTAGMIYKYRHNKKFAIIACVAGAIVMGLMSYPINLWIIYPLYFKVWPKEVILNLYHDIAPWIDSIELSLLVFNVPFTAVKGLLVSLITIFVYKPLSPIIHGYGKFAIKSKKPIPEEVNSEPLTHVQEPTANVEEKPEENPQD